MNIDINDDIFVLKRIKNTEEYFPDYVDSYLKSYICFLKKNNIKSEIISIIENFSKNIYICLVEYYCGQHNSAKYYFDKAISCMNFKDIYEPLEDNIFYRARDNSKSRLSTDEMFHIPLEKRYLVSTQRYSYPGLPCLYLGSSYQVCCDELNKWNDDLNIAIIEKNSTSKAMILNLHFFEKFDFNKLSYSDFEKFIIFWPLVACCSFVYENFENMKFRPDYIVPQLLLEYIIDKNADEAIKCTGEKVCGIKYHSVKKAFFIDKETDLKVSYNNYVFPVRSNQSSGYCTNLKKQFDVKYVLFLRELKR